ASSPGSYSATANIAVFSGGPDSLVPSTQITGAGLDPYLAILRSFRVAEDAAERLPGIPPPNRTAFVTVASEIARRVKVGIDRKSQSVEVTATASSAERAAAIANGVAGGLLQVRGAEYQNVARDAVNELIAKARGLPT